MTFTSTLAEIGTHFGANGHWVMFVLYSVIILFLIYVRVVQLRMRKIKKLHQARRTTDIAVFTSYIDQQNKYIAEIQEQYDALQDLIQSTHEQLTTLQLNGRIDKEVLDLIYQATSTSNEASNVD